LLTLYDPFGDDKRRDDEKGGILNELVKRD
jgi:hypothetical protein